jgi:hypothetical protein
VVTFLTDRELNALKEIVEQEGTTISLLCYRIITKELT